jgi:hypothetical protein
MDDSPVDRMARILAVPSRRQTLGVIGSLIATRPSFWPKLASAKRRHKKKKCKHGKKKCAGTCVLKERCCGTVVCDVGDVCVNGECVVGSGNCLADSDSCSETDTVHCGVSADCGCYQRLEGGVRCVQFTPPFDEECDQCETDADCIALGFPSGSSCVLDDGPTCACLIAGRGECGLPCGFMADGPVSGSARARGPGR